jgi:hypothetical protein
MTVCISNLPSQAESAGLRLHHGLAGFPEVARCYTIGRGIVTPTRYPQIIAAASPASPFFPFSRTAPELETDRISPILDEWIK